MEKVLGKRYKLLCLCVIFLVLGFLCAGRVYGQAGAASDDTIPEKDILTPEERTYVTNLRPLTVGCPMNANPIFYLNEETGEMGGISKRILDLVSEKTGLQFVYKEIPQGEISYQTLRDLDIDLIAGIESNPVNARAQGLDLTVPYFEAKTIIVCRKNDTFEPKAKVRIGIASGSETMERVIKDAYPNSSVTLYNSPEEVMDALSDRKVDAVISNQYTVDRILSRPKYDDLQIAAMADIGDRYCMSPMLKKNVDGSSNTELTNALLMRVLNKGIMAVSDTQRGFIIIDETMLNRYQLTLGDLFDRYRLWVIILLGTLGLIVVMAVIMLRLQVRNKGLELVRQGEERHRLLIEKSEQIVYEIDVQKGEIVTSALFKEKFGWDLARQYKPVEWESVLEQCRIHPEDKEYFTQTLQKSFADKKDCKIVVRIMCADQSYLWCDIRQFVVLDSKGNLQQILGLIRDVNKEHDEQQNLEEKSRRDVLTGLMNKAFFYQEAEQYLEKCGVEDCAMIFVDVDHFKQLNDTLGHMIGDRALRDTAAVLKSVFHEEDLVSRFGGDEFCILVKDINVVLLEQTLQLLHEKLHITYTDGNKKAGISASIGVTTAGISGYDLKKLVDQADEALYASKESGRDRYTYYASIQQ